MDLGVPGPVEAHETFTCEKCGAKFLHYQDLVQHLGRVHVEGRKDDGDKVRYDLFPFAAFEAVSRVLTFGAKKYAPDNWKKVKGWKRRYFRAALGHLIAWWKGEALDPESGEPHLAHAACCVLFILDQVMTNAPDGDTE